MKHNFTNWLMAVLLAFALPAQAVVIMTDGSIEIYDPSETYIPSGTLGQGDVFSIGWIYTDPTYGNKLTLQEPGDLPEGYMGWALSEERDGEGKLFSFGTLSEGEKVTVTMGLFSEASEGNPFTQWFSVVASRRPSPIVFGPGFTDDTIIALPSDDVVSPIPEPSILALLGIGLLAVVGATRSRRKKALL